MEAPESEKPSTTFREQGHQEHLGDLNLSLHQSQSPDGFPSPVTESNRLQAKLAKALKANATLKKTLRTLRRKLEDSEKQVERYRIASKGSREGLWVGEPQPGIPWSSPDCPAWYSPQFLALLGYDKDEFPGIQDSWARLIHPDDRDRIFEALRNHIEHGTPYHVESRLQTKAGGYRWFEGTGEGIFDNQGNLIGGGGTIRDITDQKAAEESLARNHALLNAVLEGMSDVVFVKDHEGRYLLVNSSAAELIGKMSDDIIGKTDRELFGEDPLPLFSRGETEVMRQGMIQTFEVEVRERQAISKTFLVVKEPFAFSEISSGGVLGFARDITFRKAAELTIQEREKRYRAIMENAYDLIAEIDGQDRFLYASPNFYEVLGYTPKKLLGTNMFDPVYPEDQETALADFQRRMECQGAGRGVYRYRHQTGEYRWFESTGKVFHTALGELRKVVVSRDITQRKQAEEALEAIVKGTAAPGSPHFFQILVSELAKVLRVSMVFLAETVEGHPSRMRILAFWNVNHFEPLLEHDCSRGPCEQVVNGQFASHSSGVQEMFPENDIIRSMGVEAYWGVPLYNSNQDVIGNLSLMESRPFSLSSHGQYLLQIFGVRAGAELERKRTQEHLLKSQLQYHELYDQTPLIYFTVDEEGHILSVNRFGAQLLGYDVEELLGTSVFSVVQNEDADVFQAEFERCLRESTKGDIQEFRMIKHDGTVVWVKENIQPVTHSGGKRLLLLSCEDITERKRTEEALVLSERQLRQNQKMEAIGTLASGIAHDFNNILGAILGYSELAMAHEVQDSRLKAYVKEVIAAGCRGRELVKQILTFTRRSEQDREAVDLQVVIEDVLRMIRSTFPASIEIRTALEEASSMIYADSTQIQQVVMNLCANAEYAMRGEKGVLDISLQAQEFPGEIVQRATNLKPGSYVKLTISDTGKGMPADVVDRIFEPFFTTKQAGEGTGLGLAVVHGIVHSHGGGIAVLSTPGLGTTVTVFFPRLDVESPLKPEEALDWPKGTGRVLFVDDEEMLTRWGAQLLGHLGYSVVPKNSPLEALEDFRADPMAFDVVVTDQTMPSMSGEEFVRALLRIRPDIPILICTGFSHTMSAEKAKQLGCRSFLMKPVNGNSLALALRDILHPEASSQPST